MTESHGQYDIHIPRVIPIKLTKPFVTGIWFGLGLITAQVFLCAIVFIVVILCAAAAS